MSTIKDDNCKLTTDNDTIVAQATPIGRGGVAVVRISGPLTKKISQKLLDRKLTPRYAHYGPFYRHITETSLDKTSQIIDQGIAILFPAPHSFTGEDVLELQGHGGQILIDLIIQSAIALGARMARPGEFSERAFLNDKLDLTQAEAIADLIDAGSEEAALSAMRTLQGEFSRRIHLLVNALTDLRIYVEAAIDFPEEEIDFLADGKVAADLSEIIKALRQVIAEAGQGATLREGMTVVMAGRPNAGKSSLLNQLSGRESAIVTDIPGTTRDLLREHVQIDGMPLHIIDTAGLRESTDRIEQEGIRRAWQEIKQADRILLVVDSCDSRATHPHEIWPNFVDHLDSLEKITVVQNKVDLSGLNANPEQTGPDTPCPVIQISAKQGTGITELKQHLKDCVGFSGANEGCFSARRRHLNALNDALTTLEQGKNQLTQQGAGELLAEDLRLAQQHLGEITGKFSSDDLLGKIFSSFCIGK